MKILIILTIVVISSLAQANYDTGTSDEAGETSCSEQVSDYTSADPDRTSPVPEMEESLEYQVGTFVD